MEILIIVLLILLNGVFAMSEIAVISVRKTSLKTAGKKGDKSARAALKLADDPDRFLSTIQIGITLIGILTGIYSGAKLSDDFAGFLASVCGISPAYADEVAQVLIVVSVTYLTLIFGELLPKRIGMSAAEKVSKAVARPMHLLSVAASPFVWILAKSTGLIFRLLGISDKGEKVTEQEIRMMVEEGEKDGEVQPMERNFVERAFLMGDLSVNMLMTHRSNVSVLDVSMTAADVKKILAGDHVYLSYPVIDGSYDNVIGMARLKDLVLGLDNPGFSPAACCRRPVGLYENMGVYSALEKMQKEDVDTALVFDEFGCYQGLLSVKDIFEALVSRIGQLDNGGQGFVRPAEDDGRSYVEGGCPMFYFLDYFKSGDLREECGSHVTVAGLLLSLFGHIPAEGEEIEWNSFRFKVEKMSGARIVLLSVAAEERGQEEWE